MAIWSNDNRKFNPRAPRFEFFESNSSSMRIFVGINQTPFYGYLHDISKSGICFWIPKSEAYQNLNLNPGEQLGLEMAPIGMGLVSCRGRIIWKKESPTDITYGVHFITSAEDQASKFSNFIDSALNHQSVDKVNIEKKIKLEVRKSIGWILLFLALGFLQIFWVNHFLK